MESALESLAERMVGGQSVGFIGAGYSARSGYPTWPKLVAALYEQARLANRKVPAPDSRTDLRWLAEVYARNLSGTALQRVLREEFEDCETRGRRADPSAPTLDLLQLLVARLPFNHFITTNYDDLLEDACDHVFTQDHQHRPVGRERCRSWDGRNDTAFSEFLGSLADKRRSVLHLHGRLNDETLTLTMGEYDKQYLHDAMLLRMFSIFATSTVVFIGTSLTDPDLMDLLRRSRFHSKSEGSPRHYAFLPSDRRADYARLKETFGIETIFYSTDRRGDDDGERRAEDEHNELEPRLERLLELVEARRRDRSAEADGNARPVPVDYGDSFDDVVDKVKDEVRRVRGGPTRFSFSEERAALRGGVAGSRVLRRVASDYRKLPVTYRFHHVIWISPGRIGLFPGNTRSRLVVDNIIGELMYSLGRHRATATVDRNQNLRSIGQILGGDRWSRSSEPALLVIDGVDELARKEDIAALESLLSALPKESVALFERVDGDPAPRDPNSGADPIPDFGEPEWATTTIKERTIEERLDEVFAAATVDDDPSDRERTLLTALSIVATPIAADQLSTILEIGKHDVDAALRSLGDSGLAEGIGEAVEPDSGRSPSPDGPGNLTPIGMLSPVREAVLKRVERDPILVEVVSTILGWAEATMGHLARWEEDKVQLDELTRHLPNLLAAFEAGCWIRELGSDAQQRTSDCHLWLGADLAYILYVVGRWAEAEQMLQYLEGHVDGASERETFHREVLILQAGFYGHAGGPESDYDRAIELATAAIELAHEPTSVVGDDEVTYAPARLTPSRQEARAQIRRAAALIRKKDDLHSAEKELVAISKGEFDQDEAQSKQYESYRIVADASRSLGELRLVQLRANDSHGLDIQGVLAELDRGQAASERLRCRPRGYNAQLRGEILLEFGNTSASRRCFARALVISFEFKDRYLEASARLGLAICDHRAELATRAVEIFDDLNRHVEMGVAEEYARHITVERVSASHPTLIVVVGVPGTAKSKVVSTASSVLGAWGYDPVLPTFQPKLIQRIRESDELLDLGAIPRELNERHARDSALSNEIRIVKVPTGRLNELFDVWKEHELQMQDMLCIHMLATKASLVTRNEQRRSGQLKRARLSAMIDAEAEQTRERLEEHSSLETWFQCERSAYVSIDSDVGIMELERRICDALALSFRSVEQLKEDWLARFRVARPIDGERPRQDSNLRATD